jgi:hypothetical protein
MAFGALFIKPNLNDMESADGQKSEATTHKANGLDEGACGRAKTVFEGQAAGKENFKTDETYRRRIAPKSKSVRY